MQKIVKVFLLLVIVLFSSNITEAGWNVYDANDKLIGLTDTLPSASNLMDGDEKMPSIFVSSLGKVIIVNPRTSKIVSQYNDFLAFESSDCSGTPLSGTAASYEVIPFGDKVYISDNVAPQLINIYSYLSYDQGVSNCYQWENTWEYVPVKEVSLPFSYPIALPLTFKPEVDSKKK